MLSCLTFPICLTILTYPEGHAFWTREYSSVVEKFCNSMLQGQITPRQYAAEIEAVLK